MRRVAFVAISPAVDGRALFANARQSQRHRRNSLHAHMEGKEILYTRKEP